MIAEMRFPRPSPPNVLIGGPIPPGFPLKACGNDRLVGELGLKAHTPFSFSVGERKLMNHFVVTSVCFSVAAEPLPLFRCLREKGAAEFLFRFEGALQVLGFLSRGQMAHADAVPGLSFDVGLNDEGIVAFAL
jgi:hypothetical protein